VQGQFDQSYHADQLIHATYHSLPPQHIFHSTPRSQQLHCYSELQPYMASQDAGDQPDLT
jgi:hypothetical protein